MRFTQTQTMLTYDDVEVEVKGKVINETLLTPMWIRTPKAKFQMPPDLYSFEPSLAFA